MSGRTHPEEVGGVLEDMITDDEVEGLGLELAQSRRIICHLLLRDANLALARGHAQVLVHVRGVDRWRHVDRHAARADLNAVQVAAAADDSFNPLRAVFLLERPEHILARAVKLLPPSTTRPWLGIP